MEYVNGVSYWNGDANYPFWSTDRYGDVFDRHSAYVVENTSEKATVRILSHTIRYESSSIIADDVVTIDYDKVQGQCYLTSGNMSHKQVSGQSTLKVCRLILSDQGIY